jgi:hypothetical protein
MKGIIMRPAMAMIELIFAIVIIAISVITIPSMMSIANNASKGMMIDEDILKRMMGEITKVSQARWDQNSTEPNFYPLQIAGDMQCDRNANGIFYRRNPNSSVPCSSDSPRMGAVLGNGDLNLSRGVEQLHNNPYNLEINATNGTIYSVPITYSVSYVNAALDSGPDASGTATATWTLGSSTNMNPNTAGTQTHLKRIVARVNNANNPNVDMTLTFFKSNVGKFAE